MKKLLFIPLLSITLIGCSENMHANNDIQVDSYTTQINEFGEEVVLPSVYQSEYLIEKSFEIQDLLNELDFERIVLALKENDDSSISFDIACMGEDNKDKVDEILEIIDSHLENIDFDNSTIVDYGLLEIDPTMAYLYP